MTMINDRSQTRQTPRLSAPPKPRLDPVLRILGILLIIVGLVGYITGRVMGG